MRKKRLNLSNCTKKEEQWAVNTEVLRDSSLGFYLGVVEKVLLVLASRGRAGSAELQFSFGKSGGSSDPPLPKHFGGSSWLMNQELL